MSRQTKRIILLVAVAQLLFTLGIFALPRAVQALPGRYLVRLQNHPLTGGVVSLVTTPLPEALPAVDGGGSRAAAAEAPAIPGLDDDIAAAGPGQPTAASAAAAPAATPTIPRPTATAAAPAGEPTATEPPPTPAATSTPMPTPTAIPERVVLDGLISIVQGFNNCGPANMTIALNYWGNATTQQEAASYLKPNEEDRNVSPWQINQYVNDFTGLKSTAHASGNIEILKQLIAAGFPVVIEKGYEPQRGAEGWYGHYLTVYGYDEAQQELYSRDTYLGPFDGRPRVDTYEQFARWWQHFYYTFYVIYPPERETEVLSIIPDVLKDEFTMWEYTAEIARQELEEDPDNVFTWFNLGVALTRMGQVATTGNAGYYEEATEAFDRARSIGLPPRTLYYEHRPLMAYFKIGRFDDVLELTDAMLHTTGGKWVEEIYWYRGHALAAVGDLFGAREAYQQALEVNPNFTPAQTSLDWVDSEISG